MNFSETFQIMIVLEYMSNGDLRDYLNKLPRPRLASSQGVPEVTLSHPTPQFWRHVLISQSGEAVCAVLSADSVWHGLPLQEGLCPQRPGSQEHTGGC